MLTSADWDKVRLLGLAVLSVIAIRQWLKNSVRRRGEQLTRELFVRILASIGVGVAVWLITLGLFYYSHNEWGSIPMMPGFLIGAMTVGVHRDDNLLMYVTALLNTAFYGAIAFETYPLLFPNHKSRLS